MKAIEFILTIIEPFAKYSIKWFCSELGYKSLFKAGVTFITLALASYSSQFIGLVQIEDKAFESKFKLEEKYDKSLDDIVCEKLKNEKAICNLTHHRVKTTANLTSGLEGLMNSFFTLTIFFFSLAGIAFLFTPYANKEQTVQK